MSFPTSIHVSEEGPREGFQFEKGPITTARKVELIDALAKTGLDHIQIVSFVNPKAVPGMADAEEVGEKIAPEPGVAYTGLWFNEKGLVRALATGRLDESKGSHLPVGLGTVPASATTTARSTQQVEGRGSAPHDRALQGDRASRSSGAGADGGVRLQLSRATFPVEPGHGADRARK